MEDRKYLYMQSPDGEPASKTERADWEAIEESLSKETSSPVVWLGFMTSKFNGHELSFAIVSRSSDDFVENVLGLLDGPAIYYDGGTLIVDGAPRKKLSDVMDVCGGETELMKFEGKRLDRLMLAIADVSYPDISTAKGREDVFDKAIKYGREAMKREMCEFAEESGFMEGMFAAGHCVKDLKIERRAKGNDGPDKGGM